MPPATQLALGTQMAKNGDYQHAAETIVKIPFTFPEAPEGEVSLLRSGQIYLQHLNQPETALQLFETFLQRYAQSPWALQAQQARTAARQKSHPVPASPPLDQ